MWLGLPIDAGVAQVQGAETHRHRQKRPKPKVITVAVAMNNRTRMTMNEAPIFFEHAS